MKKSVVIPLIFGTLALTAMVYAFVSQASPWVTVDEAKLSTAHRIHLAGDILTPTLHVMLREKLVTFDIKDDHGKIMRVRYSGPPPANMGGATRVVVKGKVKNGVFEADDMLLKCPSKYESEGAPKV